MENNREEIQKATADLNAAADRAVAATRALYVAISEFKTATADCRQMLNELRERVPIGAPHTPRPN